MQRPNLTFVSVVWCCHRPPSGMHKFILTSSILSALQNLNMTYWSCSYLCIISLTLAPQEMMRWDKLVLFNTLDKYILTPALSVLITWYRLSQQLYFDCVVSGNGWWHTSCDTGNPESKWTFFFQSCLRQVVVYAEQASVPAMPQKLSFR